ncbi:LysR substrate binding domain protein [Synechococcus sp. PCC 7335]|uniref:LysR family transcriptional regulator n=1 Tax=Synechococcus sp. (strain ATCC 29403 / PCC 7335) TaxID=91464 RepID=UPI00017EB4B2|nr:LysR family transcriptional regulator [Synechococcus sp. PCC 7335]EDX84515.1 LysR substrate binding domain protein [Synechococcus sp. PCC 7335]
MSKSLDRLTLLQTFVRIADAGSISAAARDLGLSQPSVSRQLAELESRFQTQLMRRTTHSLSLTEAGAELLADSRQLLNDWEALEEKHIETGEMLRGGLKVVAPVALGQLHLIDIALRFQQQHPLISLSWQLEDGNIRFSEVGCDCWIKIGPIQDNSLQVEPLGEVERLVVGAPEAITHFGSLETPRAVAKFPFIALSPFEGGQIPLTNLLGKTISIAPPVRMSTNNIFALRRATLAGLGLSVMPRWLIQTELESGQLIDLLPEWRAPKLTIHLAYLPRRHQLRRLRGFIEVMRASVLDISGVEESFIARKAG